uniref:Uncharacterized protein n=1 Tax=Rhizophagus irregularis (strain DAOM 181602 / DAOM 197198 / MUCL 43194) TaxID=747089 RepID=U9U8J2_RHIID
MFVGVTVYHHIFHYSDVKRNINKLRLKSNLYPPIIELTIGIVSLLEALPVD